MLRTVFGAWDTDGSGCLTRPEFAKAMACLGVKTSQKELHILFNRLDPDGSGRIELRELAAEVQGRRMLTNQVPRIY